MRHLENLNIAHSWFEGFNDKHGLMLCGYEWGGSDDGMDCSDNEPNRAVQCTFAGKTKEMVGNDRYDGNLKKWFEIWGHPLKTDLLGGDFEKSMVQTNWMNTQSESMNGRYHLLTEPVQIDNFILHIETLQPRLIIFFGMELSRCLNHADVRLRFEKIAGKALFEPDAKVKDVEGCRKYRFIFQDFENCRTVCLPHPSNAAISREYLEAFKPEMSELIAWYKQSRGF